MSNDTITITGLVGTTPRHIVTSEGLQITTFRLGSTQRRFDRDTEKWVDGESSWFTVTCFRQLAVNVARSFSKGEHVVVTGVLRIREWKTEDAKGTTAEIEAEAAGHDLTWGASTLARPAVSAEEPSVETGSTTE